ncbi:erythroid membrane-associated protein isoform X3 [Phascolarctos cinereus]|uniref:Erythroid membrane-associated protein isoform X3 n=1 Tax=Phascolarctos cinereus TaxID=38626 RepID=A0A6P5K1U3_PHACI|nr:erythroid membrane-associated protein isoform X3 [Phascolarctos cinereus]
MASCTSFPLSSCLIALLSLQLPTEGSGKIDKRNLVMLGTKAELRCPVSIWMVPQSVEVKWLRTQKSQASQVVHAHRNGQDLYGEQMPQYRGRTALVKDIQEDNFILEIYNVRLEDQGQYYCQIQAGSLSKNASVKLEVAAFPPLHVIPSTVGLAVILPILGLFIALGIYIIWKQRRSREKLLYQQVVEIENLLSDHGKEKGRLYKGLKKHRAELKLKRTAADAGWRRARLHPVEVTLDPDTAHPKLLLSEDLRSVRLGDKRQDVPDNPKRFDFVVSVLGSPSITSGCHYWEVCVGEKTKWILGVCSESVSRKGKITASPSNGHWLLRQSRMNEYEALTSPQTFFRLKESPRRVGIFLDYEAGFVSFYNATNKSHIYTFIHAFSGPLRPFFEPCLHDEGKNVAPLIICSESQSSEEFIYSNLSREASKGDKMTSGIGNGSIPTKAGQAPNLYALQDIISSWPSDVTPALHGLKAPSF